MHRKNLRICCDGSLTILWALILPLVLGFVGLGVEASMWYARKGDLQSMADATAIATAYYIGATTSLSDIAQREFNRNDKGASKALSLTVRTPPSSGTYMGNPGAVEIIASEPQQLLFSGLFLHSSPIIEVRAVALALPVANGQGCFMASAGVVTDDLIMGSPTTVNAPGCILVNNSMSTQGTAIDGSGTVTLKNIYTGGGIHVDSSATLANSSPNVTGATQVQDPLGSTGSPDIGNCNVHNFTVRGSGSLTPGVYCGGVTIDGNATLDSGTYIINGGNFKVSAQAVMTGSGVTLIFVNDATVTINNGASVSLSAPTDGDYAGILFYGTDDTRDGTNRIIGGQTMDLSGMLYFPSQSVQFSGGLSTGSCTKIVASAIVFIGDTNVTLNCPPGYRNIPVPTGALTVKLKE